MNIWEFFIAAAGSVISKLPIEKLLFATGPNLDELEQRLKEQGLLSGNPAKTQTRMEKGSEGNPTIETKTDSPRSVSDEATLKNQLDLILDDLEHLETEHLPEQGRLSGEICDCISKAARTLRRHARETVPIASRQGEAPQLFSELADWAQHLMDIGTIDQVASGKYDDEYLAQAGTASKYRKQVAPMFSRVCPHCEEVRGKAKQFAEKLRQERGGK